VPISLTPRDRARLKARAHALEPTVALGNAGLTKAVIAEVDRALATHELVKVKIQGDDRELRKQIGDEIGAATDAAVVHRVGKIVILFRPKPDEPEP
jgi:putative YhbY family RNA-binding protein